MQTTLIDSHVVEQEMPMPRLIPAIEDAFGAYERGDAVMPAKSYIELPRYNGDFRSMPCYLDAGAWDAAGVKWVNVHPDNADVHDLPTVMGTVIYSDPETAFPLAIIDGTTLTKKRTGAAAAVATDHLAVADASSVGIVGAGIQAYTQLEAVAEVRDIETVVVTDVDDERVASFVDHFSDRFEVRGGSIRDAGRCDVVSTITPVEDPIVGPDDLGERTHVNAIGADAEGKHELDDRALVDAKVVIDDFEQAAHSGEINVPLSNGILSREDIHAEIGAVVTGEREGRTDGDGVTVFDSTGLAIQDIAAAHVVYEHVRDTDRGTGFDLLNV